MCRDDWLKAFWSQANEFEWENVDVQHKYNIAYGVALNKEFTLAIWRFSYDSDLYL